MKIGFAALTVLVTGCAFFVAPAIAQDPVDFAHQVAPILQNHCGKCHLNGNHKGSFSFNTRAELVRADVVKLTDVDASELLQRVGSDDPDLQMPPDGERLTADEIAILRRWISEGLHWDDGFTFDRSVSSRPMALRSVDVDESSDLPSAIDQIVSRYWTSRAIDRPGLIGDSAFYRRVSLDLIGLLPETDALEAFVADRNPDKRMKLIDDLLGDRHGYAEHWLTFWNDLLRNDYSGTGYIDGGRKAITVWLYNSLLDNKPYDQMARELIAPTEASEGFSLGIRWRGKVNASQIPELQYSQNVGQVFLGVNLKCASCHDSFIDDWKLTDSYGLAAVIAERPLELHRCDVPQNRFATASFLFPELGQIDASSDRGTRLNELADLVTTPKNGRFARTIVNRLWQRLLGYALVEPVDAMSAPAWSEDLLDLLASDLVHHQFDLKRTLRLIASSAAYQSEAASPPAPGESFEFHGPLAKRLTAEQWMDGVWQLTGRYPTKAAADFGDRGDLPIRASMIDATELMRALGRPNREQVVSTRPSDLTTLECST